MTFDFFMNRINAFNYHNYDEVNPDCDINKCTSSIPAFAERCRRHYMLAEDQHGKRLALNWDNNNIIDYFIDFLQQRLLNASFPNVIFVTGENMPQNLYCSNQMSLNSDKIANVLLLY